MPPFTLMGAFVVRVFHQNPVRVKGGMSFAEWHNMTEECLECMLCLMAINFALSEIFQETQQKANSIVLETFNI